jgi:ADP-heptose:LPS heptosyltransferase
MQSNPKSQIPNPDPQKLLVLRFSAMGDVALVAPVVLGLTQKYPNANITVLTRAKFAWFFEDMKGINVIGADIDTEYKGFLGLFKLFLKLKKENYDAVIDLHDHLRTKILRTFFSINGTKVVVFDKGRAEKKAIVRKNNKKRSELPHTTMRYAAAFASLGFADFLPKSVNTANPVFQFLPKVFGKKTLSIGIAPFAKHETKQWGILNIVNLIGILIETQPAIQVYLFGGGAQEVTELAKIVDLYPKNTVLAAGKYSIKQEIELMQTLELVVCMDSSNLHLATLAGVQTVSIWGATHTSVGFGPQQTPPAPPEEGRQQVVHTVIEVATTALPCRPCSVFGDKPCFRGDHACMTGIMPKQVAEAVLAIL